MNKCSIQSIDLVQAWLNEESQYNCHHNTKGFSHAGTAQSEFLVQWREVFTNAFVGIDVAGTT
jgi:hypothetical protein